MGEMCFFSLPPHFLFVSFFFCFSRALRGGVLEGARRRRRAGVMSFYDAWDFYALGGR